MLSFNGPAQAVDIDADFTRELAEIEVESIGWLALADGYYLHTGNDPTEILIIGTASASIAGSTVLWVY